MDDDVEEQPKNANDGKAEEGKVRVEKKTVHYYEFTEPKKIKKTEDELSNQYLLRKILLGNHETDELVPCSFFHE